MKWNERLKEIRKQNNLNQKEFAELFGVNQKMISNYETGRNEPSIELLIKIADYYKISIDYLIGRYD